jgi:hypothetical protein
MYLRKCGSFKSANCKSTNYKYASYKTSNPHIANLRSAKFAEGLQNLTNELSQKICCFTIFGT